MDPNTVFLGVGDVLLIHADTIEHEGGLEGLRDGGLLGSAVEMPRQRFDGDYLHRDLAAMAAAYLYHLCMNHAFHDGNKRVGSFSCVLFLRANGVDPLPDPEKLTEVTMQIASGQMSKSDVIEWLRQAIGR